MKMKASKQTKENFLPSYYFLLAKADESSQGSAHPPFLTHVSCGNTDQPGEALDLCM